VSTVTSLAAKVFSRSATTVTGVIPDRVTTDGHDAYPRATRTVLGECMRHLMNSYLNNRLEQDHRGIKDRSRSMRGFESTTSAKRYCRSHNELRNFLLCRSHMCRRVAASTRRLEVAAMIEGVRRHCTEMEVQKAYVDSHGQSDVAFAFCHLLHLLPRLKRILAKRLYRSVAGAADAYPGMRPVLSRPIDWDLINEIVKFATSLRLGTAAANIPHHFTRVICSTPYTVLWSSLVRRCARNSSAGTCTGWSCGARSMRS
jgi:hypothetical protein